MEGAAFPATVCGAVLQINDTIWKRNAPDEEPVLQCDAVGLHRRRGLYP